MPKAGMMGLAALALGCLCGGLLMTAKMLAQNSADETEKPRAAAVLRVAGLFLGLGTIGLAALAAALFLGNWFDWF